MRALSASLASFSKTFRILPIIFLQGFHYLPCSLFANIFIICQPCHPLGSFPLLLVVPAAHHPWHIQPPIAAAAVHPLPSIHRPSPIAHPALHRPCCPVPATHTLGNNKLPFPCCLRSGPSAHLHILRQGVEVAISQPVTEGLAQLQV